MDPDTIDYPAILQEALRDAVRRVLAQVAEHGLPGEHHFYVGFRSRFPGVEVPRFLREQYPEEITIILQNQFWGLEVDAEAFSVLLSFGGSRQRLYVPFAALTTFADPSADFGLRFQEAGPPEEAAKPEAARTETSEPAPAAAPVRDGDVIRFDPSRRR
ncbi:MAG TPA: ClpXP protease specificity-enhancing factor SspB [Thermoanaerobaculia bacterium]|nr:ClpXP protease specificity-enhancing factor SspB [Thermoanaerobaculia bacterium]